MAGIMDTIVNLALVMSNWCSSHATADGWAEGFTVHDFNKGYVVGDFDWKAETARRMHEKYNWYTCRICGNVSEGSIDCDCEDRDVADATLSELVDFVDDLYIDTDSQIWTIASEVLTDVGYSDFMFEFTGLDECITSTVECLARLDDVCDAEDALLWLLNAAHISHYSGRHLTDCDGWSMRSVDDLCINGPKEYFGEEECNAFMEEFSCSALMERVGGVIGPVLQSCKHYA